MSVAHSRLPSFIGLTTALLTLIAGLGLTGAPDAEAAAPLPPVTVQQADQTPAQLRAHWTSARIRDALNHPLDLAADTPVPGATSPAAPGISSAPVSVDAAPPKNPEPAPNSATASTAFSKSVRVPYSSSWPTRATGKLLYDGGSCSASVIVSRGKNTLWTAAHCIYDRNTKKFRKNFVFKPAYKDGQEPWGIWFYTRALVPTEYINSGDARWSDVGAISLARHQTYGNIQDATGAYGYRFGGGPNYSDVRAYGYPANGYNRPGSDFARGEFMMYCRGNTTDASTGNPRDNRLRMACDMGSGASGGPQVIGFTSGNVQIVGANSHRNRTSTGAWRDISLYSSEHTTLAKAVIDYVNR